MWLWLKLRQRTWTKTVNIVLKIVNFVSASLTMNNFHTDYMFTCGCEHKCAGKMDRLGGSAREMRLCSIWSSSAQTEQCVYDIKVPREWFEFRKHAAPSALCSSRGALMSYSDLLHGAASSRTEKGTLVKHTPVYELAISSLSLPREIR